MRTYIIRRLILLVVTMLLVSLLVFILVRIIPGDVLQLMVRQQGVIVTGGGEQAQLDVEAIRKMLGMDVPAHEQYAHWLGIWPDPRKDGQFSGILQGDFGTSLWTGADVAEELWRRLPITFELGILAFIIAQLIALPVGVYSAIRQDSAGDYIGRSFAIISLATPAFWLATMIMVFPSIWWKWSPPMAYIRFGEDPLGNLEQFLIPAVLMGTAMSAATMRMLRTTMLEVLRQDYVRTAWSKGLRERIVVVRHAMRNALIPVITMISGQIMVMIGGSVIMEQIFNLPGMGRLFLDAINNRDYPYVQSIAFLLGNIGLFLILLTDLSYAYLDPRVRYR